MKSEKQSRPGNAEAEAPLEPSQPASTSTSSPLCHSPTASQPENRTSPTASFVSVNLKTSASSSSQRHDQPAAPIATRPRWQSTFIRSPLPDAWRNPGSGIAVEGAVAETGDGARQASIGAAERRPRLRPRGVSRRSAVGVEEPPGEGGVKGVIEDDGEAEDGGESKDSSLGE